MSCIGASHILSPFATSFNLRQFFNVIDGYAFLHSVGLLVFSLQLRKMAVQLKNSRRVRRELLICGNRILVFKFKGYIYCTDMICTAP